MRYDNWVRAMMATGLILLAGCLHDDDDAGVTPPPPPPSPSPPAQVVGNDVVLEWNALLTQSQGAGSLYSFRQYAMLHVAMFDAANAMLKQYQPYFLEVTAPANASQEAAAAQAARDVMVALYPAATATFDAALAARIATLPPATAEPGIDVGKQAAQAVLQRRAADGSAGPDPAYLPPLLPGLWQPAVTGQVAAGTRFATMLPFALHSPTQYLPAPPPPLNSAGYAQSFQQVLDMGRADSAVRTADQTQFARQIAGVNYRPGPFALWNDIARGLAESRQMPLLDAARMFALLNVAMHDGLMTSHTSKYVYQLWRPVTAIAGAADDANDATMPDVAWTPLLTTPPYPSHASNVSCIGTSAARALARLLDSDAMPFSVTWTWTGAAGAGSDVTRNYGALSELAHDAGMSRVHGGIHFDFEVSAAEAACNQVGDFVFDHFMRPL